MLLLPTQTPERKHIAFICLGSSESYGCQLSELIGSSGSEIYIASSEEDGYHMRALIGIKTSLLSY